MARVNLPLQSNLTQGGEPPLGHQKKVQQNHDRTLYHCNSSATGSCFVSKTCNWTLSLVLIIWQVHRCFNFCWHFQKQSLIVLIIQHTIKSNISIYGPSAVQHYQLKLCLVPEKIKGNEIHRTKCKKSVTNLHFLLLTCIF
jgi:hypothetical protein